MSRERKYRDQKNLSEDKCITGSPLRTRIYLQAKPLDVNCVDSLGRGALTLAIESENLEMVELLVVMGVDTRDSLLFAIDEEFVEAVELLLEHEELLRSTEVDGPDREKNGY